MRNTLMYLVHIHLVACIFSSNVCPNGLDGVSHMWIQYKHLSEMTRSSSMKTSKKCPSGVYGVVIIRAGQEMTAVRPPHKNALSCLPAIDIHQNSTIYT